MLLRTCATLTLGSDDSALRHASRSDTLSKKMVSLHTSSSFETSLPYARSSLLMQLAMLFTPPSAYLPLALSSHRANISPPCSCSFRRNFPPCAAARFSTKPKRRSDTREAWAWSWSRVRMGPPKRRSGPLDLRVTASATDWLCSTFAAKKFQPRPLPLSTVRSESVRRGPSYESELALMMGEVGALYDSTAAPSDCVRPNPMPLIMGLTAVGFPPGLTVGDTLLLRRRFRETVPR
mmetsp:Transcript_42815/g.99424  ORF Transcript_42815/g.99424 Transcript_42815/m.99424 type:complete len:236 (-) Transcript_42815:1246-1953(-)